MSDKFIQPIDGIRVVKRSGVKTLLTEDILDIGRSRIASGEDPDEVARDLAIYEVSLIPPPEYEVRSAGGQGSGNFGHSGRPGHAGGSSSEGGSDTELTPEKIAENDRYYGKGKWRERTDERGQKNVYIQMKGFSRFDEISSPPYKEESRAVKNYVNQGYRETNSGLRSGDESKADPALDRIISRNTIEQDATLYRVISSSALRGLKEGDAFEDKGYVSTTWHKDIANRLATEGVDPKSGEAGGGHIVEIAVSKGQHAFEVEQYESGRDFGGGSEKEYLLPRGMRFVVGKVDSEGRLTHIKAELK